MVSTLMQVGGGERLIFEVREALQRAGVQVTIATWYLDPVAFFEGKYSDDDIVVIGTEQRASLSAGLFRRASARVKTLLRLRRLLREVDPDMVVCQSEYDVVAVFLATLFTKYRYAVKIFGQSFVNDDIAKYTLVFRRQFRRIRDSVPEYARVPLSAPRVGVLNRLAFEGISLLRYAAVRAAKVRFVLAPHIQSEVQEVYGVDAVLMRSGFPASWLARKPAGVVAAKWNLQDKRIVVCISRLVAKKQVELVVRAFATIRQSCPDAHLLIGGRGPEEAALRAVVRELGISEAVTFAGYIPEAELVDYYADAAALINLDIAQFNIVGNEALGARRHMVCLLPHQFGDVFTAEGMIHAANPDSESVGRAIEEALAAPAVTLTPRLATALHERTWDAYARTMLQRLNKS